MRGERSPKIATNFVEKNDLFITVSYCIVGGHAGQHTSNPYCLTVEDELIRLQHAFPIDPRPSILGTSLQRVNNASTLKELNFKSAINASIMLYF